MKPALQWSDHTKASAAVGGFSITVVNVPTEGDGTKPWRAVVRLCGCSVWVSPLCVASDVAYNGAWSLVTMCTRPVAQAEGWVK